LGKQRYRAPSNGKHQIGSGKEVMEKRVLVTMWLGKEVMNSFRYHVVRKR
jgi:hypothetical protein